MGHFYLENLAQNTFKYRCDKFTKLLGEFAKQFGRKDEK